MRTRSSHSAVVGSVSSNTITLRVKCVHLYSRKDIATCSVYLRFFNSSVSQYSTSGLCVTLTTFRVVPHGMQNRKTLCSTVLLYHARWMMK